MPELLVRPQALSDIEEAVRWYEKRRPGLGDRLLGDLDNVFQRVRRRPLEFPVVGSYVRRALLRKFPYAVYFQFEENAPVEVLAVLHLKRRPGSWQRRQ